MELIGILLGLLVAGAFCGWVTHAAWVRGRKLPAIALPVAIAAAAGWFWHLATIATGSYLAGLGEMLVALALVFGPGAGALLGILTALDRRVGLVLSGLYAASLSAFCLAEL
ncbi:hypothetical protein G5B31_17815 [Rhodobacter sp. SGA-6-6]|uniref:hypothetical protein n=1 Tax=Rhodobacter sp. SGA-6-6 TaxID=2710882 RepID=UPI0013EBEE3E|nr:hypothetical protein [Rhodobacter sp. SGA-6-6]NGM47397.1 hypothetical protein [Rhodobacter sp. SGA-6-6]